jgi:hypothetical protein
MPHRNEEEVTTTSHFSQPLFKGKQIGRHSGPNKDDLQGVEPSLGKRLRNVLEEQYAALLDKTSDKHQKLDSLATNSNKSLPVPIALLFAYITECTQITRRPKHSITGTTTTPPWPECKIH